MPKVIDHDERRAELVQVVLSVIAREGLASATIRRIAREGGFTSGLLSHYFSDKEEMLNFAFNAVADLIFAKAEKIVDQKIDVAKKFRKFMSEVIPNKNNNEGSVVSLIFWSSALHHAGLRSIFDNRYEQWRDYLRRILAEAEAGGLIKTDVPVADRIDLIIALADGLTISWVLQPERCNPTIRVRRLDDLARLAGFVG